MSIRLRDIMTSEVFTLRPEMDASSAVAELKARHYGGAPVVDDAGKLLGVVSWWDLLGESCNGKSVAELMTPHIVAMKPDDTAADAAKLMLADNIHRVVVMDGGDMVGIVTSMSLLVALK